MQKKEKRYKEISLQERLPEEMLDKIKEFQREMNKKDYTRNHKRRK